MKQKLMKVNQWIKREFAKGSEPSLVTVRKWIKTGVIAGRFINGGAYVFDDQSAGLDDNVKQIVQDLMRL
ncbi:hypothetical protein D5R81_12560 [Parashewanella spongiae]|uniref:Excisionase n=1 Tax=Parashewanella spongiae TaxID=342950 RepID=A0A3A6TK52_9GAMM|nr:hypothetical protein [Parashewanella spongiae]MCL1078715.1 hypothetical protein [Parashewanella spongiae]RJY12286.1 hypothetical protein D5R81_12560 [Parashewanella spongiae]